MALLDGKTGIIFGVANKRSIAWAIAQALAGEGMRLAFTYQGERLKEGVEALTSTMPEALLLPCDVTVDGEIDAVFAEVGEKFGRLDALVHSVAFAPREDMENEFHKTSRDGFKMATTSPPIHSSASPARRCRSSRKAAAARCWRCRTTAR